MSSKNMLRKRKRQHIKSEPDRIFTELTFIEVNY